MRLAKVQDSGCHGYRVTLPQELVRQLRLSTGDWLAFDLGDRDLLIAIPVRNEVVKCVYSKVRASGRDPAPTLRGKVLRKL